MENCSGNARTTWLPEVREIQETVEQVEIQREELQNI